MKLKFPCFAIYRFNNKDKMRNLSLLTRGPMELLRQLFAFAITILLLVSIHEAGHFVVARLLGIKVTRYAIGFGKPIFRWLGKTGTEYVIAPIPLGGYVKLLDEREVVVPKSEITQAFNQQSIGARALVVAAGPLTNFLFAIFAFWLMFLIGVQSYKPLIGEIKPNSIAARAGLQAGDEIRRIDGVAMPDLQKVVITIIEWLGEKSPLSVEVVRENKIAIHNMDLQHWQINAFQPDPLQSIGIEPARPPLDAIINDLKPDSPAAYAGLRKQDKILFLDGQSIKDWYQFKDYISKNPGKHVTIIYQRQGNIAKTTAVIGHEFSFRIKPQGYLGVKPKEVIFSANLLKLRQYPPIAAFYHAIDETGQLVKFNFVLLKKLIVGQLPLSSLGGPLAIFQTADFAFQGGIGIFLGFLALLSVMLGCVNILPIPGLDGGYLFNYLIEIIIRRPVSLQYEIMTIRIGMIFILALIAFATFNDILRIIW